MDDLTREKNALLDYIDENLDKFQTLSAKKAMSNDKISRNPSSMSRLCLPGLQAKNAEVQTDVFEDKQLAE